MLKYKTVKLVWESDLQDLLQDVYGRRTEFAAENEMGQNETRDFTVPSTKWLSEGDEEIFERWRAGESIDYGPDMQVILNDLHAKGVVEAGEYVVEVWW